MNVQNIELPDLYNYLINSYIELFEDKQNLMFTGWEDVKGGIAKFGRYHKFDFKDIIHDVDTCQSKDEINDWVKYGEDTYREWTDAING